MPCSFSSMRDAAVHFSASPTSSGTMCDCDGSSNGYPRATSSSLRVCDASCMATRSSRCVLRWRTDASAPAASDGGSDVVKMKPLAVLRSASMMTPLPATYPPMMP